MADESYFQFPLCALAYGSTIKERFQEILAFCVMEVGEAVKAKVTQDIIEEHIRNARGEGSVPTDFRGNMHRHIEAVLGARTTNVRLGSVEATIRQHKSLGDFIERFEFAYGRSPLVRIKTEFVWDILKNDGMSNRELTILCAVYSCIGAKEWPVRITKKTIGHRMLGYKSEAMMKAEIQRRPDREKPLTERQILTTLDKLHSRGFFARMRANARQTYYSHRLTQEEMKKALYEMKTRRAIQRRNRIEEDNNLMEWIKATNEKASQRAY